MFSAEDVGLVEKIAGAPKYDIQGTEASTVCSDYLHTSLATWDEVGDANTNNRFVSSTAIYMITIRSFDGSFLLPDSDSESDSDSDFKPYGYIVLCRTCFH